MYTYWPDLCLYKYWDAARDSHTRPQFPAFSRSKPTRWGSRRAPAGRTRTPNTCRSTGRPRQALIWPDRDRLAVFAPPPVPLLHTTNTWVSLIAVVVDDIVWTNHILPTLGVPSMLVVVVVAVSEVTTMVVCACKSRVVNILYTKYVEYYTYIRRHFIYYLLLSCLLPQSVLKG